MHVSAQNFQSEHVDSAKKIVFRKFSSLCFFSPMFYSKERVISLLCSLIQTLLQIMSMFQGRTGGLTDSLIWLAAHTCSVVKTSIFWQLQGVTFQMIRFFFMVTILVNAVAVKCTLYLQGLIGT